LRGHTSDMADARALVKLGKVMPAALETYFVRIEAEMIRYPAIDVAGFEARIAAFVNDSR
jgi:hypothetical protein